MGHAYSRIERLDETNPTSPRLLNSNIIKIFKWGAEVRRRRREEKKKKRREEGKEGRNSSSTTAGFPSELNKSVIVQCKIKLSKIYSKPALFYDYFYVDLVNLCREKKSLIFKYKQFDLSDTDNFLFSLLFASADMNLNNFCFIVFKIDGYWSAV
ncbi:hypothetical protein M5K25_016045 [Dendrobium thyrsiflorum]|uniref:Uncharacterized protein n=1 Tax=Dendrobium thyrsiflorum TaxID=117978 RepID=A0ABD0USL3_DENTH